MLNIWEGKLIVVGITGSIAAYKAVDLVRRLVERGARVRVLMTAAAERFISPVTLRELSRAPVVTDLFAPETAGDVITHVQLGLEAAAFVVAPASADMIGKMANGLADDPVSTTYLVTRAPVIIAPAMNSNMYTHPAVQANIARLRSLGCIFVGPEEGRLASGHRGPGRFSETEKILAAVEQALREREERRGGPAGGAPVGGTAAVAPWAGRKVLVTAGGTREPLDPVRFIGNRSSGKMGLAVAAEALRRGAQVTVVMGTVDEAVKERFLAAARAASPAVVEVERAQEMLRVVMDSGLDQDVVVMAAAVADFRPKTYSVEKIKRVRSGSGTGGGVSGGDGAGSGHGVDGGDPGRQETLVVELVPNPDILATLGRAKVERGMPKPILVGFAAESGDLVSRAREKLARKPGLDLLVANDVRQPGSGFGSDTNAVTVLYPDGRVEPWPLMTKDEVARKLCDLIQDRF